MEQRAVGRPLKRLEDPRLLRGAGRFLDDLHIEGLTYVAMLRSPHAHATIHSIDTHAARACPGVIAIVTADDLAEIGTLPAEGHPGMPEPPVLARGKVTYAGEPVVAVVADHPARAQDALAALRIEFELLPAIVDPAAALAQDAPLVHPVLGSNLVIDKLVEAGDVEAAFADADHTLTVQVNHARIAAVPIETRGGIAAYDADNEQFTLWLTTQNAWQERAALAHALGVAEERVRVITPDVGGGFGAKGVTYPEDILLLALARLVGRPVQWIATRSEDLQTSTAGREARSDAEVAFDNGGRIRALRLRTLANLGAYLVRYATYPLTRMLYLATGVYAIEHLRSEVVGVFTNTGPVGAYRGAGRGEACFFIERVISEVAHALGLDQAEVRLRNFIPSTAFPYTNAAGLVYDSGDYARTQDRALELLGRDDVERDIATRRARGELLGLGIATGTQSAGGGWESARLTLSQTGRVTLVTGSSPHGQGLVTSYAQIVSDALGVAMDEIDIVYGDTAVGPAGLGTYASRSLQHGGVAARSAALDVAGLLKRAAAQLLEAAPDDLLLRDGTIAPIGAPERALPLPMVVRACVELGQMDDPPTHCAVTPEGLVAVIEREEGREAFPFGTAIALVSIDRDTGRPWLERLAVVHDCGTVVNPLIVEGQLSGGILQGIGETLWEAMRFDADGQLLSGTLLDYALPRATTQGPFVIDRTVTPTPRNPLGAKGVGELGTVLAPAAIANAITDALRPFGARALDLPITEEALWRIIHQNTMSSTVPPPDER